MRAALLVAALALAPLAGCFSAPTPACAFRCGPGDACPSGYACAADGWCKRDDVDPGYVCEVTPDAAVMIDASTADAGPDAATDGGDPDALVCPAPLDPTDDGGGAARQALVLSEVNPGDYVEVYNDTASAMDLDDEAYRLVSGLEVVAIDSAGVGAGITIGAGGYAVLDWPAAFADAVDGGGEVMLYLDATVSDDDKIMDFVCWGTAQADSRKADAEAGGKWTAAAACADALADGAIHREIGTTGLSADDYDVDDAPSPVTCDQP
jgi:hypothetical protein